MLMRGFWDRRRQIKRREEGRCTKASELFLFAFPLYYRLLCFYNYFNALFFFLLPSNCVLHCFVMIGQVCTQMFIERSSDRQL